MKPTARSEGGIRRRVYSQVRRSGTIRTSAVSSVCGGRSAARASSVALVGMANIADTVKVRDAIPIVEFDHCVSLDQDLVSLPSVPVVCHLCPLHLLAAHPDSAMNLGASTFDCP